MQDKEHTPLLRRICNPRGSRTTVALLLLITCLNLLNCITHDPAYWYFSLTFPYRVTDALVTGEPTLPTLLVCAFSVLLFLGAFAFLYVFSGKTPIAFLIAAGLLAIDMLAIFLSWNGLGSLFDLFFHLVGIAELCGTYYFSHKDGDDGTVSVENAEKQ